MLSAPVKIKIVAVWEIKYLIKDEKFASLELVRYVRCLSANAKLRIAFTATVKN